MRVIGEAEAQEGWERLLDDVERGQIYIITRDDRAIARLEPAVEKQEQDDSRVADSANPSR